MALQNSTLKIPATYLHVILDYIFVLRIQAGDQQRFLYVFI